MISVSIFSELSFIISFSLIAGSFFGKTFVNLLETWCEGKQCDSDSRKKRNQNLES
ncbi:MAG: hypothetical protein HQM10_12210 [Candidatus Riflebacteria bacterium]|nr:hypothetical protein [Candidatus Riflebacteria bacterium]